jgi:hypothetical protein
MRDCGRTVRADRTPGGNHIGRVPAFARTRNLPDRVHRRHESALQRVSCNRVLRPGALSGLSRSECDPACAKGLESTPFRPTGPSSETGRSACRKESTGKAT